MTMVNRYNNFVQLWEIAVPDVPLPRGEQILHWLSKATDEEIETTILKLPSWIWAKTVSEGLRDANAPYKYVSATLRRLQEERTFA